MPFAFGRKLTMSQWSIAQWSCHNFITWRRHDF